MTTILRQVMNQTVHIENDEWAAFEPFIAHKKLKKRGFLIKEGQICHDIHFILRGSFRQFHLIDGEEKTTFFFFDHGFACNYESYLTQQPSDVTIEAMEDCELLYFNRKAFDLMIRLYPKYEAFSRMIAENVYLCAMARLKTFLLNSPEERYQQFLKGYDAARILARVPQHYIASYLGITPVSLSRIRARVKNEPKKSLKFD